MSQMFPVLKDVHNGSLIYCSEMGKKNVTLEPHQSQFEVFYMVYKVDRDREIYPGTEMSTIHPRCC